MKAAGGIGDGGSGGGDAGDTGGNDTGGDNSQQPTEFTGPEWAKEWEGIKELEADVLNDPSLKVFDKPTAFLKSYVHAQKQLGKKGVIMPTENSPKEEWDQFWGKVGVPTEEAKYKETLKLPAGEENKLGDEFAGAFMKLAHEHRVLPKQAAEIYNFFSKQVEETQTKVQTEYATKVQSELNALRDEWGEDAFTVKKTKAETLLKEYAGEDFIKYLGASGLGKNAQLIKAFAAMADKVYKEGDIPSGDPTHGMTINDLERDINLTMADLKGPYYNPNHPDHKRMVDEVLAKRRKLDKALSQRQ
jgi:hypothetical protein